MIPSEPLPADNSRSANSGSLRLVASIGSSRTKWDPLEKLAAGDRTIASQPPESFAGRTVSIASGRGYRHFQKERNKGRKSQVPPGPESAA
jgi:hypothetical protein